MQQEDDAEHVLNLYCHAQRAHEIRQSMEDSGVRVLDMIAKELDDLLRAASKTKPNYASILKGGKP